MKKHINLFSQQVSQRKSIILINKMRKIGFITVGILAIILAIEWTLFLNFSKGLEDRVKIKTRYSSYIMEHQALDTQIKQFLFKYQLLKSSLNQDANISYYYGLLNGLLTTANAPNTISAFSINNTQEVSFTLTFLTYEEATAFMTNLESLQFIEFFDELELKAFSILSDSGSKYSLQFIGKFKQVQDAKSI